MRETQRERRRKERGGDAGLEKKRKWKEKKEGWKERNAKERRKERKKRRKEKKGKEMLVGWTSPAAAGVGRSGWTRPQKRGLIVVQV